MQKFWVWLKSVPGWIWGVLGAALAYFAIVRARMAQRAVSILQRQRDAQREKESAANVIDIHRDATVSKAEAEHTTKNDTLTDVDRALQDKAEDISALADEVNNVFGDD